VEEVERGEGGRTSYFLYLALVLLPRSYTTHLYLYILAFHSDLLDKRILHFGVVVIWF
jgi:hypothetical protein